MQSFFIFKKRSYFQCRLGGFHIYGRWSCRFYLIKITILTLLLTFMVTLLYMIIAKLNGFSKDIVCFPPLQFVIGKEANDQEIK